jgi:predicted nucleic acid-binding protein
VLYVDSSVLVKQYIEEPGATAVRAKIKEESLRSQVTFISDVGYAEILAAFARKFRDNLLQANENEQVQKQFQDDWLFSIGHVELTVGVLGFVSGLVNKHPLKGADAIHLASALWLRDALRLGKSFGPNPGILEFATSDKQLKNAASLEGLSVFDPQIP